MPTFSPSQLVLYECHHCGMVVPWFGKVTPDPVCICGRGMAMVTDEYRKVDRKPILRSNSHLPT